MELDLCNYCRTIQMKADCIFPAVLIQHTATQPDNTSWLCSSKAFLHFHSYWQAKFVFSRHEWDAHTDTIGESAGAGQLHPESLLNKGRKENTWAVQRISWKMSDSVHLLLFAKCVSKGISHFRALRTDWPHAGRWEWEWFQLTVG